MADRDALLTAFQQTLLNGAGVVVVRGGTGCGKTRLIQDFYDQLMLLSPGRQASRMAPDAIPPTTTDLLHQRKRVVPTDYRWSSADPWFWIGACCSTDQTYDSAAVELATQLTDVADSAGYKFGENAGKTVGKALLDLTADITQVSTVKTAIELVWGMYRSGRSEYESRVDQAGAQRRARVSQIEAALSTIGVISGMPARGKPLVVVLDDAHLAGDNALSLLTTLLMVGTKSVTGTQFFPDLQPRRDQPILAILCVRDQAVEAPAAVQSSVNRWLAQATRAGLAATTVSLPDGLGREAADALVRGALPNISESDREAVIGATQTRVNPLLLMERLSVLMSAIPEARRTDPDATDSIDLQQLPGSLADPIRDLYRRLPPSEQRLVSSLAQVGVQAPWAIVSTSDGDPEQELQSAVHTGIVKIDNRRGALLTRIVFWEDLYASYLLSPPASSLYRDQPSKSDLADRALPWLSRLAADSAVLVADLGAVGASVLSLHRYFGTQTPFKQWKPGVRQLGSEKDSIAIRNWMEAGMREWPDARLATELLIFTATPDAVTSSVWAGVLARRRVDVYIDDHALSLAARSIVLARGTLPKPTHLHAVRSAVSVDGALAVRRLPEVAALSAQDQALESALNEIVDEYPHLAAEAALVRAHEEGPAGVIRLVSSRAVTDPETATLIARAHAASGDLHSAATALMPFAPLDAELTMRVASYLEQAGEHDDAGSYLESFPVLPYEIAQQLARLRAGSGDLDAAIGLVAPFFDQNPNARLKASQFYTEFGHYLEALDVLGPLSDAQKVVRETRASLRSRRTGVDRRQLPFEAEQLWRAGQFEPAVELLRPGLDDSAVLAVWAEYQAALGRADSAVTSLIERLHHDSRLAMSVVELAMENWDEAECSMWLRSAALGVDEVASAVLKFGELWNLLRHQGFDVAAQQDVATSLATEQRHRRILRSLFESPKSSASAVETAVALERSGFAIWGEELLASLPWSYATEAQRVRLLVDYGRLAEAAAILDTTHNRHPVLAAARTCMLLHQGDLVGAAAALRESHDASPQFLYVSKLLPTIGEDPWKAARAWRICFQMHYYSLAWAVLSAASDTDADIKKLRAIRYAVPSEQRMAYSRIRRRYAIRQVHEQALT